MTYANKAWTELGAAPTVLIGPVPTTGNTGGGVPVPQFSPGTTVDGNARAQWVLATLVLAAPTTLANGQAYVIDRNFTATLLTTANSPRGSSVGYGSVSQASVAAGTYYIWLQIRGHCPVQFTGVAAAIGETTATGGLVNFTNTPTGSTKAVLANHLYVASQTFTADAVINTAILSNVSSFNDVAVGATVAGTGIPASTTIVSFGPNINGVNQITMSANATATNAGITVTQTGVITANLNNPSIGVTN